MRNIGIISEHASPLSVLGGIDAGGQNVYVAQIAKRLAAMGHHVDVFTRRDDPNLPDIVELEGIRVIHVPAGPPCFVRKEDMLQYMGEFATVLLQNARHYDLMHANFWMSGFVATELKRRANIPFVITFHALGRVRRLYQRDTDEFPDQRFSIEDRIVAEADNIIAECPQDHDDVCSLYGANPDRVTIIPCGYDDTEMVPVDKRQARDFIGVDHDGPVILQLGRLVPRKGIDTVIRGLGCLVDRYKMPATLLVVGGESDNPDPVLTSEIGRLMDIARECNVSHLVRFVGRRGRDVLRYYYSAADVFVTMPWYEPFGITPVESMACGTPVIGADVGGIKYTIRDGRTGFLVPPHDYNALADKLALVLCSTRTMRVLGEAGRKRASSFFTWDRVTRLIAGLYENVLVGSTGELGVTECQVS